MGRSCFFQMVLGGLLIAGGAQAQTFGKAENSTQPQNGISFTRSDSPDTRSQQQRKAEISDEKISKALSEEKAALNKETTSLDDIFLPGGGLDVLSRPTQDNSQRGDLAVVELNEDGRSRRAEKIFLYYDNFKMSSYLSNSAACDVRFIVLTNLDRKLVSLDVKLVWPEMTTALSFSNVSPNTPTYLNYTLMGNGCYNMDQMPNIVVNRCRIRGMNSAECADKIVWLSAVKKK